MANNDDRLTCADFRARRERMGLARRDVQDALNVTTSALFKWETTGPKHLKIAPRAWDWLKARELDFALAVRELHDSAKASAESDFITLVYPQTTDYDRAIVRAAAERLMAEGYEVMFTYTDDTEECQ